jgi:flavin-dependent dehydrogenase
MGTGLEHSDVEHYDVVVVGARAGGAATATLLARSGLRVLLLDRDRYGTDTLSTHALMRGAVLLLSQWGLLDRLVAAGTPAVRRTRFHYGAETMTVTIKPTLGVEALYAPRRTVLDSVLVEAAAAAGAEVRFGMAVTGVQRDGQGRVVGVTGRSRSGGAFAVRSALTVGADGRGSTVAAAVGARMLRTGTGAGAVVYGYWSDLPVEGYEWFYRPGHTAGLIPTNDGEVCVFAGVPAARFAAEAGNGGLLERYHRMLVAATGGAGGRFAQAVPPLRLRTWVGRPSFIRQANGPGWALVGDAGSFVDPLSTHGITDALRDAELLSRSVKEAGVGADLDAALTGFAHTRDRVVGPLFDVMDGIAGYGWDLLHVRRLLLELSSVMSEEVELIAASGRPSRVPS